MTRQIILLNNTLHRVGLTYRYRSYGRMKMAVELALEDSSRLEAVVKEIYYPVSKEFHCTVKATEYSLRLAVKRAWRVDPDFIKQIAEYPVEKRPSVSAFIEILVYYIEKAPL